MGTRKAPPTAYGGKAENQRNTTKPGPGRPPNAFYIRLQSILDRADTAKNIEKILKNPDHPQYARILEYATDRAFGKVPQAVEQKHEGDITVRVVRDE